MNDFTIKIALDDADRQRLDALIASINRLADVRSTTDTITPAPLPPDMMNAAFNRFLEKQEQQDRIQKAAQAAGVGVSTTVVQAAEQPVVQEKPADPPAIQPTTDIIPLADFQAAIAKKCAESAAMKNAVRKLVNKYAPAVSEIPEEKRAEVMQALSGLKA